MHTARCHTTHRKGLKILAPKLMLQRLKIAPAQVKPGSTSENLLNETRQIVHFLLQAKEITKKVYNNMINSITLQCKMDLIFMNPENSKIFDPRRLSLNFSDKVNL